MLDFPYPCKVDNSVARRLQGGQSIRPAMNDDSPVGKLLEGVIESVDEFYSTNNAHDTIRGMKENARRGFLNGGNMAYGLQRVRIQDGSAQRSKATILDGEAAIVRRVFQLVLQGMGAKEIVRTLNQESLRTRSGKKWAKSAVYYMLTNEIYTGALVFNRVKKHAETERPNTPEDTIRVENAIPAIIDRQTFTKVQQLLAARAPKITAPRALGSQHLLSSLVFCGKCGARMTACSAKSGRFNYYACNNYLKRGKDVCDAKLIPTERLEAFVIERLKQNILTEANLLELVQMVNERSQRVSQTWRVVSEKSRLDCATTEPG